VVDILTNKTEKITVCIPVRNGAEFIGRAIESVLEQSLRDFRLEIADNCSSDETVEIVKGYLSDERIELVARSQDIGMYGNFNACLEDVKTKYYMLLSHDDLLCDKEALEIGLNTLENHPAVPAVYCETLFVDEHDKQISRRSFGLSGLVESDSVARKSIVTGRNVFGVPLLIRTSAVQNTRYDSTVPNSADVDFSIGIGQGREVYYVQEALVAIRFHKVNNTARIYSSLEREFLAISEKHKIRLSAFEMIQIKINNWMVGLKKTIFFFYLDKIRN
jgi:glycosyltransferase involved in cell wall biosynthesis